MIDIDKLRLSYLAKPAYEYDESIHASMFSDNEIELIKTYGRWFQAIWNNEVPLVTEKLKHFHESKAYGFKGRTKVEDVWYRYKMAEAPF